MLAVETMRSLALAILGLVVLSRAQGTGVVQTAALFFTLFIVVRWAWIMADWWVEKFIVTDKRVLLVTGIAYRKVAIMPLVKVTDLTFNRSPTGMMLGYGEFVVESAGQDQALSKIQYIPRPEKLYIQMSELLFGGEKAVPALPSPAEREAELELGKRALNRRRRILRGWRRRPGRGAPAREDQFSDLDDLLARRDTLLAEREARWAAGPRPSEEAGRGEGQPSEDTTEELPPIHDPLRGDARGEPSPRQPLHERPEPEPPSGRRERPPRRWTRGGRGEEPTHGPPVDPADD
jgi:Bacterial PH domain